MQRIKVATLDVVFVLAQWLHRGLSKATCECVSCNTCISLQSRAHTATHTTPLRPAQVSAALLVAREACRALLLRGFLLTSTPSLHPSQAHSCPASPVRLSHPPPTGVSSLLIAREASSELLLRGFLLTALSGWLVDRLYFLSPSPRLLAPSPQPYQHTLTPPSFSLAQVSAALLVAREASSELLLRGFPYS
jgi:hypothetical protein